MSRHGRVVVLLVALAVVAGDVVVLPGVVSAAPTASPGKVRDPEPVPGLESAPRDLAGELNTPVAGVDASGGGARVKDPDANAPVDEVVGLRSEGSETWTTRSGNKVTKFFGEPKWYRDAAGAWQRVDTEVVEDPSRPGVFRNAGADWTATFEVAGSGVGLSTAGRDMRFRIVGDPSVAPEKDPSDPSVVWYRNIRPGVDLQYLVSAWGLEESWVVHDRAALAAGGFVSGFESEGRLVPDETFAGARSLDWNADGRSALDGEADGPKVRILPPVVTDVKGRPLAAAKASLAVDDDAERRAGPSRRTRVVGVDVDPGLAGGLADAQFPVTVDPMFQIIPATMGGNWGSYNQAGNLSQGANQWGLLGDWQFFGGHDRWRFNIQMGYQYLWTNIAANARVVSANLKLDLAPYPTSVAPFNNNVWQQFPTSGYGQYVNVCHASAWSYAGAYPGWDQGKCRDWYYYGFQAVSSVVGGYPGSTLVDVTNMLRPWVAAHDPNGVFGVSLKDDSALPYDFKATIPSLEVTWDTPSPAAPLVGPADGSTLATSTPTLSVGAVTDADADQNPPMYNAVIYAGQPTDLAAADPTSNCKAANAIWSSGYGQNVRSWTVPPGVLQDGVTYYWAVATMGYTLPGYPTCSGPWKFKVDSRLGTGRPYPTQQVGPFTVNAATGNLITGEATHTVATVGGAIGPSFGYNSQAPAQTGLRARYIGGAPPITQPSLPSLSDPAFLQRVDPQVNFEWSSKGPLSADDWDSWIAEWSGFVTVPSAGSYCFGTKADDGTRVWVGGTLVLDNWVDQPAADKQCSTSVAFAAGESKSIVVQYYDHRSVASIQLKVYGGPTGTQVVPSGWLSPELHPLGPGWTMSVEGGVSVTGARMTGSGITLVEGDGSTTEYTKNAEGAYVGPAGDATRVSVDKVSGDMQVDDDDASYRFDKNGALQSAVTAADDRKPAATKMVWSGSTARLTSMVDPVSNKAVNLYYGGDAACATPPSGFAIAPGQLCQVKSWDGRTTDLFYSSGRLARVVNPGGDTTDFSYDAANRITQFRDALAADAISYGKRADDVTALWAVAYDGSGRVSTITAPAPTAGAARSVTTLHYNAAATPSTLGDTTVNVSGVSEPSGYSARLRFDDSLRTRETYDVGGRLSQVTYDGTSDRVSYADSNVGTAQAMRSSTVYDTSVVFNGMSRPTDSYGPAPVAWFDGAVPIPAQSANVAHTVTRYDEGIYGLAASWWDDRPGTGETYTNPNRPSFRGAPKSHKLLGGAASWNWGTSSPDTATLGNDYFTGRLSGLVYLPTAGTWTFAATADDGVRVTVDDHLAVDTWATPLAKRTSPGYSMTAGWHRIAVDVREDVGSASLTLWYTAPGGVETVIPSTSLKPDFGLVTSTVDANGVTTTTGYGTAPELGLPTTSTVDPAGLALVDATSYEALGSGYLRRTARAMPGAAAQSKSTSTYTPYGDAEVAPAVSCAGSLTVTAASQRGLSHLTRDADPNTLGGTAGITREQVHDDAGRVVATRTVGDAAWACTSFDSRGRPAVQTYPAGGGQPARTVTNSYVVGGDPMLSSVSDPAGTITTRVDLLGRVTDTKDVWGTITHVDYDAAGRPVQSTVFKATGAVIERVMSDYATTGSGVNQMVATRWSNAAATVTGYDATALLATTAMPTVAGTVLASVSFDAIGRATTVTYASGVTSSTGFDGLQRVNSLTHAKGATPVTANTVARNPAGQIVDDTVDGVDANPAGANYTYDNAGRLVDWSVRDPESGNVTHGTYNFASYSQGTPAGCAGSGWFDAYAGRNSNRLEARVQLNGGAWSTTSYCYDHADRLRTVAAPAGQPNPYSNIGYDAHGNTTTLGGEALVFDGAERHVATKAAVAPTALLVVGKPAGLTSRDSWMKSRLIADGFTVTVVDDDGITAAAAAGKSLVVITDSVSTAAVGSTFASVAVPVLASEVFLYDDLGMTGTVSGTDFGSAANQTQLVITPAGVDSLLGAGLAPGTVTTSTTAVTTGWAKPTSAATVAAVVPSDLSKAAIFAYDTGALMAAGTAPARRVGWWHYELSTSGYSKESKDLFDAAVAWASGVTPTISYSRDAANRIVQRSVNGSVAARCSYTGSGDTSDLTLDSTGTVIQATLVLSGGVVFTWRNTAAVWSFPNLHGDVAAVTDGAGVKQGPTRAYAPFGQPLTGNTSGELDNSAGEFDYGWHGAAQRPVEHQSGTHALIEMGARPYDPSTGRFLQVDPIEGGTPNDYVHPTDPVNQADLTGSICWSCHWKNAKRWVKRSRHQVVNLAVGVAAAAAAAICAASVACGVGVLAAGGIVLVGAGAVAHRGVDRLARSRTGNLTWRRSIFESGVSTVVGGSCGLALGGGCGGALAKALTRLNWQAATVASGGLATAWILKFRGRR
jgi:RHS repeat-associated protein